MGLKRRRRWMGAILCQNLAFEFTFISWYFCKILLNKLTLDE